MIHRAAIILRAAGQPEMIGHRAAIVRRAAFIVHLGTVSESISITSDNVHFFTPCILRKIHFAWSVAACSEGSDAWTH